MKKAMKMMQGNDKMRRFVYMLGYGLAVLCFSSCQDAKLAEQLGGTWHTSFALKDEDGMPYTEEQDVKFVHIRSNVKDGGRFKEKVTTEIKFEEYTMNVSCKQVCTISGEWEIIGGDLYMEYDLSSLDVEVEDVNRELLWDDVLDSVFGIDYDNMLAEEIRKNAYRELYEFYSGSHKENDKGDCCLDLSIEDNTMSYSTSDLGRVEWIRIE